MRHTSRIGLGRGRGSGYRNIRGNDPRIHGDSAKGIKQPQRLSNLSFPQLKKKGVFLKYWGDADKDGVPNVKDCRPLNPNAQADYQTFQVKNGVEIIAHFEKTRSGFRHIAILMVDGREVDRAKETYQNRTWERYEFETVIRKLLKNTNVITEPEKKDFIENGRKASYQEAQEKFGTIAAVAKMGEVLTTTQKEKNDWKKRMLKVGLPQLDVPEDWDTLSEDEKEKRLNNVISHLQKR